MNWCQDTIVSVEEVNLSRYPRIALPELGARMSIRDMVPGRARGQATIVVNNNSTRPDEGAEAITHALAPFVGTPMTQENLECMAGVMQATMANNHLGREYDVVEDFATDCHSRSVIWSTANNTATTNIGSTWIEPEVTNTLAEYTLGWDLISGQVTITGCECGDNTIEWQHGTGTMVDPKLARLRQNLMPILIGTRFGAGHAKAKNEKKARELLHGLVGDQQFRRYLKHGFVTLRGKSGLMYQIFPGGGMTRVWKNGKQIEKLCVVMVDSSIPPSDSVVMRLLMIMDCEQSFRKVAVVWRPDIPRVRAIA